MTVVTETAWWLLVATAGMLAGFLAALALVAMLALLVLQARRRARRRRVDA